MPVKLIKPEPTPAPEPYVIITEGNDPKGFGERLVVRADQADPDRVNICLSDHRHSARITVEVSDLIEAMRLLGIKVEGGHESA